MLRITKLERSKKRRGFINVFVDDDFAFSCSDSFLADEMLFVDKELSDQTLEKLIEKSFFERFYTKLLNYLVVRPRSEFEIRTKIRQYFFKEKKQHKEKDQIIEQVITKLKDNKYINDEAFADWLVESRLRQEKKSWKQIELDLMAKGVDRAIIDDVRAKNSEKINGYEYRTVKKIIKKKKASQKDIFKLKNYLYSKGFKPENIDESMDFETQN